MTKTDRLSFITRLSKRLTEELTIFYDEETALSYKLGMNEKRKGFLEGINESIMVVKQILKDMYYEEKGGNNEED